MEANCEDVCQTPVSPNVSDGECCVISCFKRSHIQMSATIFLISVTQQD